MEKAYSILHKGKDYKTGTDPPGLTASEPYHSDHWLWNTNINSEKQTCTHKKRNPHKKSLLTSCSQEYFFIRDYSSILHCCSSAITYLFTGKWKKYILIFFISVVWSQGIYRIESGEEKSKWGHNINSTAKSTRREKTVLAQKGLLLWG